MVIGGVASVTANRHHRVDRQRARPPRLPSGGSAWARCGCVAPRLGPAELDVEGVPEPRAGCAGGMSAPRSCTSRSRPRGLRHREADGDEDVLERALGRRDQARVSRGQRRQRTRPPRRRPGRDGPPRRAATRPSARRCGDGASKRGLNLATRLLQGGAAPGARSDHGWRASAGAGAGSGVLSARGFSLVVSSSEARALMASSIWAVWVARSSRGEGVMTPQG